jgi:hypothetical protein
MLATGNHSILYTFKEAVRFCGRKPHGFVSINFLGMFRVLFPLIFQVCLGFVFTKETMIVEILLLTFYLG